MGASGQLTGHKRPIFNGLPVDESLYACTVGTMDNPRETQKRLLVTPFVSSWIGRARNGDRLDPDPGRRTAAWGHWAVANLVEMTGAADRTYAALLLEGRFHDPRGQGPLVKPHLEVQRLLDTADAEFPERLAQAGNGLMFPWWVVAEVTALKRALCSGPRGELRDFVDALNSRRVALADALMTLSRAAAPNWGMIEELLISSPDGLSGEAAGDFSPAEVTSYLPAASEFDISVTYDEKLRDTSRQWASRRVGVWQIQGTNRDGERFSLGVVTPRLTASSQFQDQMFSAERESPAALLVRGLILRRLIERHMGGSNTQVGETQIDKKVPGAHLRAIVAQVGAKLPEAGVDAAVGFVRAYPDCDAAWRVLAEWSERTKSLLTVREEGFREAHRRIQRFVKRAEEPDRDDINVLLPLAWDAQSRVVRVTFSRREVE